jgi:hypothetical protein
MNDRVSTERLDRPRDRCPSCRAPIVGTNPTDFPALNACFLHSRYAEFVANKGIDEGGNSFVLDDILRV